ncbi:hypothetical protein H0H81_003161 [Sphagnurus paluster]|uniref:Uncharacterized protein n=1 Tax=Sphagnurus paluster TaxID=117069 RepID=A0A9P7GSY9_9AGAR|nr:hypothetical protein H0H81_003161 [Sphagnurus paluster]
MRSPHPPLPSSAIASSQATIEPGNARPRYRERSFSLTSLQSRHTLEHPKAAPVVVTLHTRAYSAYGSFAPTPSARPSLSYLKRTFTRPPKLRINILSRHSGAPGRWTEEDDSPLSSGMSSPTIPSFSRTASPPPLLSPSFPSSSTLHTLSNSKAGHTQKSSDELDPILAKLERKSRLLTKKVSCVTCKKGVSDVWREEALMLIANF